MTDFIKHKKYGSGSIKAKRYHGFEVLVEFHNGVRKWISTKELESNEKATVNNISEKEQNLSETKTTLTELSDPNKTIEIPAKDRDLSSRFVIESLRLGGVPQDQVKKFSIGREKELQEVLLWLDSGKGALQIFGEYGAGKSHFLEILSSFVLESNWACSRIEIDAQETPFHKPKEIYESFVRTFSYKQNGISLGFEDFIRSIVENKNSIEAKKLREHPYLGELLKCWNLEDDKSELLDWIKGKGPNRIGLPKMYEQQTSANVYCNIISGLGWAAKNIVGLNGIIIFFDEAETVDPYWYTKYQFEKARNFLKGIILVSNNDISLFSDLPEYRQNIGRTTGLIYSRMTNSMLPFIWKEEANIKILFSFVPEILESMKGYPEIYTLFDEMGKIEIETLDDNDLQSILQNIREMYKEAYDFSERYDIYPYIPHDKTRKFVKGTVECLDLMRYHPEKSLDNLLVRYD